MRLSLTRGALALLASVSILSCTDTTVAPIQQPSLQQQSSIASLPEVRISEIHYDNTGTDADERIEISGPAGTDVSGWTVVLYNGSNGATYTPLMTLSGTIPATCGARGVIVLAYPVNGIQNGSPDGIALVDGSSNVIEFLSYEGTLTAVGGPADGMTSVDIGVSQSGTEPLGSSIQRTAANTWIETEGSNTFGACNDNGDPPPPQTVDHVHIAPATATILVGGTQQFIGAAHDEAHAPVSGVTFEWSSTAQSIATVSASGLATGIAAGSASIVLSADGKTDIASLTVEDPPAGESDIVISQVYGGGGNSGATYTHDFVELFNRGEAAGSVSGWTIQYANSTNTNPSWATTTLSGSIPAGGYYLVRLASQAAVGVALPAPDATGTTNIAAGAGKILLVSSNVALSGVCPSGATLVDRVNYGVGGAASCETTWGTTANLTSSTAALRLEAGCTYTGNVSSDFIVESPSPRNSSTALNDCAAEPPPPEDDLPPVRFSELRYDNSDTDFNEAIEVEGPAGTAMTGWSIVLYNGSGGAAYNTTALSGVIADQCSGRGTVFVYYPSNTLQNGAPDGMALVNSSGVVVEFLSYEGTFTAVGGPADGMASTDIGASQTSAAYTTSLRRNSDNTWTPHTANFGACGNDPGPTPPNAIIFTGREPFDAALPVGFEDQLFGNLRDGATGGSISSSFIWVSETPSIATIDAQGVFRALADGTAVLRGTAHDGTTATTSLPTIVATENPAASYIGNTEFGDPVDSDASDDFIIRRNQFTTSFNNARGIPNWVSYNLEAPHMVSGNDRCDCFTFDPELETAGFARYTTADYTGAGAFHGYGIDRGHLARSFDRTIGSLDNARTFYFANIIPQAADNNQGPWAAAESYLGSLATSLNKELYIITGASGSKGTVKNEGRITIPTHVWKVAVIMERDRGLADIDGLEDLEVIALILPNDAGIRNVPWETYKTTVDAVEALSGYDVLSLLPDQIEIAVESDTKPPVASTDGPYTSNEGSSASLSGASSSDPDGDALTYSWDLGDGNSATGDALTHTYAQDGTYTVTLTVTDSRGLTNTTTTSATVGNVTPSVSAFDGATLLPGETYTASGSFSDPGADTWTATADYGDGSGASALSLSGMSFSLSHTYNSAGTFNVTVAVSDDDATSSNTATVTVLSHTQAINDAIQLVNQLVADGKLTNGRGTSLKAKLNAATNYVAVGNTTEALTVLQSTLDEIDALVRAGRLASADANALTVLVQRIIDSIA